MSKRLTIILAVLLSLAGSLCAQPVSKEKEKESTYGEKTFAGLELRPIDVNANAWDSTL